MRPLACWKIFLRESRLFKSTTTTRHQSSLYYNNRQAPQPRLPPFNLPSSTPKSTVFSFSDPPVIELILAVHERIRTYPPPPSVRKAFPCPLVEAINAHISVLDPTGARTQLFSRKNRDAPQQGDILLATFKTGEPFAGVCLSIRRRGTDTAILLRNRLLATGVEMWVKIYSPNVRSIEVVQRAEKRARRARLYYLRCVFYFPSIHLEEGGKGRRRFLDFQLITLRRKPEHDRGNVDKVVETYLRKRRMLQAGELKRTQGVAKKVKKTDQGQRTGQKNGGR
ncbi:hypothetical protein MMC07_006509 [Pseudocyphellaria aurata]|nr:hypothetical protein [Pseudocyphellaria aurata]